MPRTRLNDDDDARNRVTAHSRINDGVWRLPCTLRIVPLRVTTVTTPRHLALHDRVHGYLTGTTGLICRTRTRTRALTLTRDSTY
jgi:hypothetical protein